MGKKIGFIGCGNMAGAMIQGILDSGKCLRGEIIASARTERTRQERTEQFGITMTGENRRVAEEADVLFLAVKPRFYGAVIEEIREAVRKNQIIVSIAPGKTLEWLKEQFGQDLKLVRMMPNTPVMVKEGMMGMCANEQVTEEETSYLTDLCEGFSRTEAVPEGLMDVVTAVSGSSPAYVFLFIEAMADAAVAGGMPREQAYVFAAQAVLGSAKLVLESGMHPAELKDMVCSPGGTTIQAVRVLEEKGMRSAVIEAMLKCMDVSKRM